MLTPIPHTPDAIDLAWLSEALGGRIDSCLIEELSDRRGVNGEVFRLHLTGDGVPATVVVKFPGDASRGVAVYQRWYEREVRFYQELARSTPVRTPRCYAAEIDTDDHFILVLEDLGETLQGDQVQGCSPQAADAIVRSLAGMHARWWGQGEALAWLPFTTVGLDRAGPVSNAFTRAWGRVRHLIPGDAQAAVDAATEGYVTLLEEIAATPTTLCHGDFRLDNLFLPGDGAGVVTFDWQFACRARGMYDVAYFLALDMDPGDLATHEDELLHAYLDALAAGGVEGYTEVMARRDYAVSLLLSTAVFAIGASSPQPSEASRVMHEVGLARLGSAVARIWHDRPLWG